MSNSSILTTIVLKSESGDSILKHVDEIDSEHISDFRPNSQAFEKTVLWAVRNNLAIQNITTISISFMSNFEHVQLLFGVQLREISRKILLSTNEEVELKFWFPNGPLVPIELSQWVDFIELSSPD